ncbi:MAG TPA: glycosyltransferase family 39 protein [Bryobacteraceae bacterium]
MLKQKSAARWVVAILCGAALWLLYFFGLTRIGLLGPDEPRYAAIGQAMAQSGDWITPRLWGQPWFEKPALLYWMTAAAFKAGLGPELAPRLPVAIASVGFLIFFFFVLRRQFGERAAFIASAMLATSAGWLVYSHIAVPDLPMSVAFSAAMLAVMPSASPRRAAAAGLLLGLAILAKGLVPVVLLVPAVWFLRREIRSLFILFAIALAIAAPWYALVAARNGVAFYNEFFGKQQFARFLSGEFLHAQPFWFYIPVLAGVLFPWTPLIVLAFSRKLYQDRRAAFLLAWFGFGFVFLSLSRGKLPGYLLPLLPALAALLGVSADLARERSRLIMSLLAASVALLWLVPTLQAALPGALAAGIAHVPLHFFLAWLLPIAAIAAVCALLEAYGRRIGAVALLAVVTTALIVRFIIGGSEGLDREASARARWRDSAGSITCVPRTDPFLRYGFDFYAGRELPDCK